MALTEKQQKWIINHFKNTKNDVIMHKLNIKHSTLHRFAREAGLKKTKKFQQQCQLNASKEAVLANKRNNWPPKGYIIPRSAEFRLKSGITPAKRLGKKRNQERIRKSAEKRRLTVTAEKRRVLFGLEQKTKLKVVAAAPSKNAYRYTLKKRGYIVGRAARIILFDQNTNRSNTVERTATEKYKFTIKQLEETSLI